MSPTQIAVALLAAALISASACKPAASRDDNSQAKPDEAEPVTVENDQDVFPAAFRGRWAADEKTCQDPDGKGVAEISARRISEFESDSVLLKNALSFEQGPDRQSADTLDALVAQSGEGELGFAKMRLSLAGNYLYVSREGAPAAQHWSYPLIRCR